MSAASRALSIPKIVAHVLSLPRSDWCKLGTVSLAWWAAAQNAAFLAVSLLVMGWVSVRERWAGPTMACDAGHDCPLAHRKLAGRLARCFPSAKFNGFG